MVRRLAPIRSLPSLRLLALSPLAAFALLLSAAPAAASSGGISGQSMSGCSGCHNASGVTPTVAITGPGTLAPGAMGTYRLTISGGPAKVGGLDVSVSGGVLSTADGTTRVKNGEITQTGPKNFTGNTVSFDFKLMAPSTAGTLTLYGAGLSANGDASTGGDDSATGQLAVTVASASDSPTIAQAASASPSSLLTGGTSTLTVLGSDSGGESALTYTWAATGGPGGVTFSPNGTNGAKTSTATFSMAGTYVLQATVTNAAGKSATSSVSVSVSDPSGNPDGGVLPGPDGGTGIAGATGGCSSSSGSVAFAALLMVMTWTLLRRRAVPSRASASKE